MKTYEHLGKTYYCPVDLSFALIGGKWKGVIVWNLRSCSRRYSELKRALVVINDKSLSKALQELEKDGIVIRTDYHEVPPKVDYRLSDRGQKLLPIFEQLYSWGEEI